MVCRVISVAAIVVVTLTATMIETTNAFSAPTLRTRTFLRSFENYDHRHTIALNAISFGPSKQKAGNKPSEKWPSRQVGEEDRWSRTAEKEESIDTECVMTIRGTQYNMTAWARAHPGGPNILRRFNGKDATSEYDNTSELLFGG